MRTYSTVQFNPRANILDAANLLRQHARTNRKPAVGEFNGVKLTAWRNSTVLDIIKQYDSKLNLEDL